MPISTMVSDGLVRFKLYIPFPLLKVDHRAGSKATMTDADNSHDTTYFKIAKLARALSPCNLEPTARRGLIYHQSANFVQTIPLPLTAGSDSMLSRYELIFDGSTKYPFPSHKLTSLGSSRFRFFCKPWFPSPPSSQECMYLQQPNASANSTTT